MKSKSWAPYRIVLWGVGAQYNALINSLKNWEEQKQIEVAAVTAKEIMDVKRVDGWRVVRREELKDIDFDYLIICNDSQVNEIITEALSFGLEREKMVPSRVLKVPYFDWESYDRIRKSRVSIVSANCWGGILCHTLGMECLSPFKNLWVSSADIIKMMSDFRGYMSGELSFARWQPQPWGRHTEQESEVEAFIELSGFRKICFVPDHINQWRENKEVWGMNFMPGQSELWDCVNFSVCTGRNSYVLNIFKMLEGEQIYRYEK